MGEYICQNLPNYFKYVQLYVIYVSKSIKK